MKSKQNDDGLTKTTGPAMGRRKLLKTAAAGTAAVTVGGGAAVYGTQRARAFPPALAIAGGTVAVGGAYLIYREHFTGEDKSDEMAQIQQAEIHTEIYQTGQEMHQAYDEQVLTQISNLLETWDNALYNEGLHAGIEQLNLGNGLSAAKTEAEAAVNAFVAKSQKNVLDHVGAQNAKMCRYAYEFSQAGGNPRDVLGIYDSSGGDASGSHAGEQVHPTDTPGNNTLSSTLVDGTTYSYIPFLSTWDGQGGSADEQIDEFGNGTFSSHRVECSPPSTGSRIIVHDRDPFATTWSDLQTEASDAISELNTFFDNIASSYTAGDISLSEIVTPSALADAAREESSYPMAGAHLASLGMQISGNLLTIEMLDDDLVAEGEIYTRTQPQGGFQVGATYDPNNMSGPVFLAFQTEFDSSALDSSDTYNNSTIYFNSSQYNSTAEIPDGETVSQVVELEQEFAILEASDLEGNPIDNVSMDQPAQQTLSTDIQELSEELSSLTDYQLEILEEQRDLADQSGGGGGGIFPDLGGAGGLAVLGVGGAFLYALVSNS